MKKIIKKYQQIIPYVLFTLILLFYVRVIISLCLGIKTAKNGGFDKLFEENSPLWRERSMENMIIYDEIWIICLISFVTLSSIYVIKKPKLAVLLLIIPYFVALVINF